jgi:hypothetical protein
MSERNELVVRHNLFVRANNLSHLSEELGLNINGLSEFLWYWTISARPAMNPLDRRIPESFTISYWLDIAYKTTNKELENLILEIYKLDINEFTLAPKAERDK